ncbi:hypothetical protein [Azospirillum brasilense]|uniref:hypothetical protein n=1 Tax=Azospirillum brasilense TaxID=192 RepID=UPI0013B435E2|nr:hypothetical protein [Azospirillum brasilense]
MAEVEFILGAQIQLDAMLPANPGNPTALPVGIQGNTGDGVYIIINVYPNNNAIPFNRYMGVTTNFNNRFASRQGSCFELGLEQHTLNGVDAYLGTARYRDNGGLWHNHNNYTQNNNGLDITLDGQDYDLEHIFIKGCHYIFGGTITNTLKVAPLVNNGAHNIVIRVYWDDINNVQQVLDVTIPPGGQLA